MASLSKMAGSTTTAFSGMLDLKLTSPVNCKLQISLPVGLVVGLVQSVTK